MNLETLEFLKELYTGYKQYGYKFSLVYSTDQSEKLEQQKMLEYLEDNGYIILTSNSIGFRGIEFTDYGLDYIENLI